MNTIILIALLAIVCLFLGIYRRTKTIVPTLLVGLSGASILQFLELNQHRAYFNDMLVLDNFAVSFGLVCVVSTLLIFFVARRYYRKIPNPLEDIFAVLLFALIGALCIVSFGNITMLFVGIEILSVSLYILAGSKKTSAASNEASIKYFLMGSFATGVMLFGIALIYGVVGSFDLHHISQYSSQSPEMFPLIYKAGVLLICMGMAFKVAAVPFHFWSPDVYHGSPTLITAFMASVVKVATIAAFYRLFSQGFGAVALLNANTLAFLSAASIVVGNLGALYQRSVKRMLAYSSIAHTGYMLMLLTQFHWGSQNALLLYAASYSVATIGIFSILILIRESTKDGTIEAFTGLSARNPFLAFVATICMLSLLGIPPLSGFAAKYFTFLVTLRPYPSQYAWLVVVAIVGSAISAVYYFRIINKLYQKPTHDFCVAFGWRSRSLLIIIVALIFVLGIVPAFILKV